MLAHVCNVIIQRFTGRLADVVEATLDSSVEFLVSRIFTYLYLKCAVRLSEKIELHSSASPENDHWRSFRSETNVLCI
jgi:hypothetical protein